MFYDENGKIIVEPDDKCFSCIYLVDQEKPCPLLEALSCDAVFFEEELNVGNCSWYIKKERKLKVVKDS